MSANRVPNSIRIGLMTDEPIRLAGLLSIFDQCAETGRTHLIPLTGSLEKLLKRADLDCLIVDIGSSMGGLAYLNVVRRARPAIHQIVIGPPENDELIQEAIIAGARAYLDLTVGPDKVLQAVEEVMAGTIWAPRRVLATLIDRLLALSNANSGDEDPHLTTRERQVLDLILLARSNREIAGQLGIEERTVKAHVGRLMRKTGADNRIELSMRALHAPMGPGTGIPDRRRGGRRPGGRRNGDGTSK
jgi:DNA-binding NarL/FixJ family response regulator